MKKVYKVVFTKQYGHYDGEKFIVDGYKTMSDLVSAKDAKDAEVELTRKVTNVHKIVKVEECVDNVLGALCPALFEMADNFRK